MRHPNKLAVVMTAIVLVLSILPFLHPEISRADTSAYEVEWSPWDVIDYPTCTEPGYEIRYSSVGISETRQIPATGHSFGGWTILSEPTCVTEGLQQRTCSVCGMQDTQSTGYGDHQWGSWYTQTEASCWQEGIVARTCALCGAYDSYSTGYGAHSWGDWYTEQEQTCAQEGILARTCSACGAYESYSEGYAPHSFGSWEIVTQPGDFSAGIRRQVCQVCGAAEEESFDPEGTLRYGDSGEAVEALQESLNAAGYNCGTADGLYGNMTLNAVAAFEADHNMNADGVAWPGVQKALTGVNPAAAYNSSSSLTLEQITNIQSTGVPGDYLVYVIVKTGNISWMSVNDFKASYSLQSNAETHAFLGEGSLTGEGSQQSIAPGESLELKFSIPADQEMADEGVHVDIHVSGTTQDEKDGLQTVSSSLSFDLDPSDFALYKDSYLSSLLSSLPEMKDGSAAICLTGSYDDSVEWKENDLLPIELTLTNIGSRAITDLNLDAALRVRYHNGPSFEEQIYSNPDSLVLQPMESYTVTYNYPVMDAKPGDDISYIYFTGSAHTVDGGITVNTTYNMPDPLHKAPVGNGAAAIVLNASYTPQNSYQAGDEIIIDLDTVNVGECELSDLLYYSCTTNKGGIRLYYMPDTEQMKYLHCQQEVVIPYKHIVTQQDLDSGEITIDFWVNAKVNTSKILGGTMGAILGAFTLHLPLAPEDQPALMTLSFTDPEPPLPLYQMQLIPINLHLETSVTVDQMIGLIAGPLEQAYGEYHTFYKKRPVGALEAGGSFDFIYQIDVQPYDLATGKAVRRLQVEGARYNEETGNMDTIYSNTVEIVIANILSEQSGDASPKLDVTLVSPVKPYYLPGEQVEIHWSMTNEGSEDGKFDGVFRYETDPVTGASTQAETIAPADNVWLAPQKELSGNYQLTVPQNVSGTPLVVLAFDGILHTLNPQHEDHHSNQVILTLPVPPYNDSALGSLYDPSAGIYDPENPGFLLPDDSKIPHVTAYKTEYSCPKNGQYYQEGESIIYYVEVANYSGETLYDIRVTDIQNLFSAKSLDFMSELTTGYGNSYHPEYIVTKADVERGYVTNMVLVTWMKEGKLAGSIITNLVVSDTDGIPDPVSIVTADTSSAGSGNSYPFDVSGKYGPVTTYPLLPLWPAETESMTETSLSPVETEAEAIIITTLPPADTEAEAITITTLPPAETEAEHATIATLPPVETETEHATITVLPPETGEESGTITVLPPETGAEPGTSTTLTSSVTAKESPAGRIRESFTSSGKGGASCYYSLQATGDGTAIYEVHFCRQHMLVSQLTEEALAGAKTSSEKLMAWQMARSLWQNSLDAMYEEFLLKVQQEKDEHLRSAKEEIIRNEKELFYQQLAAYEAELMLLFPDNLLLVAEKEARLVRSRVMDMCYEMNNPSKQRMDSYAKEALSVLPGFAPGEDCSMLLSELPNGYKKLTRHFCEEDASILNPLTELAIRARDYPELFLAQLSEYGITLPAREDGTNQPSALTLLWQYARTLWMKRLDGMLTQRYLSASEDERGIIAADRKAFAGWLSAREALLELFYEDHPEIVAEVMASAAMERAVSFCEAAEESGKQG